MATHLCEEARRWIQGFSLTQEPSYTVTKEGKSTPQVINIMAALKESMEAKGRGKVRDVVRKRMGKAAPKEMPVTPSPSARPRARRPVH